MHEAIQKTMEHMEKSNIRVSPFRQRLLMKALRGPRAKALSGFQRLKMIAKLGGGSGSASPFAAAMKMAASPSKIGVEEKGVSRSAESDAKAAEEGATDGEDGKTANAELEGAAKSLLRSYLSYLVPTSTLHAMLAAESRAQPDGAKRKLPKRGAWRNLEV